MAGYRTEWWPSVTCNCEWRDWCQKWNEDCLPCNIEWFKAQIDLIEAKIDVKILAAQEIEMVEARVASLAKEEKAAKDVFYKAKREHEAAAAQLKALKKKRKVE